MGASNGPQRHRFSRFDVFLFALQSYARLKLQRVYLFVELDAKFAAQKMELRNRSYALFGDRLRLLSFERLVTQQAWREAMQVIVPPDPLGDDDRPIWFLQNDDHGAPRPPRFGLRESCRRSRCHEVRLLCRQQCSSTSTPTYSKKVWPSCALIARGSRPYICHTGRQLSS